jgi:lysophospholipase L1-like esterase
MSRPSYHIYPATSSRFALTLACILFFSVSFRAQTIHVDENAPLKQFPYISMVFDRIFNSSGLDSFYEKLLQLKKTKKGTVSIVHIGDSHVQSGYLPGEVRKGLQDFFGGSEKGVELNKNSKPDSVSDFVKRGEGIKKEKSGIIYHALGIIGARFETFNRSNSFWENLPSLHADLYIISLGTNNAQSEFNEPSFLAEVSLMIGKLKKISPHAAVLITTAADSFKSGYPNRELWNLNISLFSYCAEHEIPIWDLYRTTNGFGSAYNWIKRSMMDADGIHYTGKAYQLQGQLLFDAIAKGYNNYVSSY